MGCRQVCLAIYVCIASGVRNDVGSIERMVERTPEIPDFRQFFEQIGDLGRRVVLACPCAGIHGCGYAMQWMGVNTNSIHVFDVETAYAEAVRNHLRSMGMENVQLHMGPLNGDILRFPLSGLLGSRVDFLVCGPPCPPWSGQGSRGGGRDSRADVMQRVLVWLVLFVKCCGLVGCVIENVIGITQQHGGCESYMSRVLPCLESLVPEFAYLRLAL